MKRIQEPDVGVPIYEIVRMLIATVNELYEEIQDLRDFIESSSLSEEYGEYKMVNKLKGNDGDRTGS